VLLQRRADALVADLIEENEVVDPVLVGPVRARLRRSTSAAVHGQGLVSRLGEGDPHDARLA